MSFQLRKPGLSPTCSAIAALLIVAVHSFSTTAFAAGGLMGQTVDFVYNLHDQAQDVVMKSFKGVAEAMQDAPPPSNNDKPFTLEDLKQIQQKYANLYNLNKNLADGQQKLLNIDAVLLQKLPPNDPRRAGIQAEMKQLTPGLVATRQAQTKFAEKLRDANAATNRWRAGHDSNYVPPKQAEPPPTDAVPHHHGGADLNALQQREAALQAEAIELSQQRTAAILNYLNNPTPENRAYAAAIAQRLRPLVDQLNQVRDQVDSLRGTSRQHVHIVNAATIAQRAGYHHMPTAGGTNENHHHGMNEHHHQQQGLASAGNEEHHHHQNMNNNPYGMQPTKQKKRKR